MAQHVLKPLVQPISASSLYSTEAAAERILCHEFFTTQHLAGRRHVIDQPEDRAGALLVVIFAAILSFWIVPETLKYFRSR